MLEMKDVIGDDGHVTVVSVERPQVVVFTFPRPLSRDRLEMLRAGWKQATAGTDLENVKAIILDGGVQISIVDSVESAQ